MTFQRSQYHSDRIGIRARESTKIIGPIFQVMFRNLARCGLLLLLLGSLALAKTFTADEFFADGAVVACIGDSITHGGRWHRYVAEYCATRFPDRSIRFLNGGISGDSAGGVLTRLDQDILSQRPNAAVVMLGMNDVQGWLYKKGAESDPQLAQKRQRAHADYVKNMGQILDRLQREGQGLHRILLMTPSPYDQTAQIAREAAIGQNEALGTFAQSVRELAAERGLPVVDNHATMTAMNLAHQKADPTSTIINEDRVHPGPPGSLVMAWLFLKACQSPALVSHVALDVPTRSVVAHEGAEIEHLAWEGTATSFTLTERSLPWPIAPEARPALDWAPILDDLNRQTLAVTGLPSGTHTLYIDDVLVGTWSDKELATGVNLAGLPMSPQLEQARRVQLLCEERRRIQEELRSIPFVELMWIKAGTVDLGDFTAVTAAMDMHVEKHGGPGGYFGGIAKTYRTVKPQVASFTKRVDELSDEIRAAAHPVPHRYRLNPILPAQPAQPPGEAVNPTIPRG